ncbi:PEP-CTERM sorting domain-containing protein [Azohydromonas caseinilytica]|uniref:PEP-CTERM sorting domain-containing protein n=1 Tax=Azohydromonas caseinilytica TaxID=2728836 RepID=A0A848FB98_9BURK|nr:PEP-CTERM sorting domain-containing protein [Azohydromonas caseinilytica]NML16602.1 PEP-CTERM sorting domain-containing protein [Azohydromonas caseinilytica]
MKNLIKPLVLATALLGTHAAQAALYTSDFGTANATLSNCDDCGIDVGFPGAGQTIAGLAVSDIFVHSNGFASFFEFDQFSVLHTDLDSRNDPLSNVYINTTTAGQMIVTWQGMGHFSENYSVRSTFQLVLRSDQYALAPGEGQFGFFYGDISDPSVAEVGFLINDQFQTFVPANSLSNASPAWYRLNDEGQVIAGPVAPVPEPGSLALAGLGLGMSAWLGGRRRRPDAARAA